MLRSKAEKIFLFIFFPAVFLIYIAKSYPDFITNPLGIDDPFGDFFFVLGKNPNFWYQTVYTAIVVVICLKLLFRGKNPYGNKPGYKNLSSYQKKKFTSILLVQFIGFYFFPFVFPMIKSGEWSDKAPKNEIAISQPISSLTLEKPIGYSPTDTKFSLLVYVDGKLLEKEKYTILPGVSVEGKYKATGINFSSPINAGSTVNVTAFHLVHKMAHVYVSPSFFDLYSFLYIFLVVPIFVWFFGKRYCSWICACGNLAETVGTTKWGKKWVKEGTPRGKKSLTMEWIQVVMLLFSIVIGISAILNLYHIVSPSAYDRLWYVQDFVTDFMFGSIIGVGVYPFFGTRIWCRYGCPLARWMNLFGRWSRSKYAVTPNNKCKGIGLCTEACPMGIPVEQYAHKDKKPIEVSFGLHSTACIGCGGCIDACPVDALSFQKIGEQTVITTKQPEQERV